MYADGRFLAVGNNEAILQSGFIGPPVLRVRHFADDGDLILSHLAAALSAVFPDGEDFFVRSVRQFRDRISDPTLMPTFQALPGASFIVQGAVPAKNASTSSRRSSRRFDRCVASAASPSPRSISVGD